MLNQEEKPSFYRFFRYRIKYFKVLCFAFLMSDKENLKFSM